MGEGVWGIYKVEKQRMSGPRGIHPRTIHQQSKGYFIHLGIIQRLIQKVVYIWYLGAYVCVLFIEYGILFVSVHPVVTPCTSALKDKSIRPPTLAYIALKDKSVHSVVP
jgi:hypothetical protein